MLTRNVRIVRLKENYVCRVLLALLRLEFTAGVFFLLNSFQKRLADFSTSVKSLLDLQAASFVTLKPNLYFNKIIADSTLIALTGPFPSHLATPTTGYCGWGIMSRMHIQKMI